MERTTDWLATGSTGQNEGGVKRVSGKHWEHTSCSGKGLDTKVLERLRICIKVAQSANEVCGSVMRVRKGREIAVGLLAQAKGLVVRLKHECVAVDSMDCCVIKHTKAF